MDFYNLDIRLLLRRSWYGKDGGKQGYINSPIHAMFFAKSTTFNRLCSNSHGILGSKLSVTWFHWESSMSVFFFPSPFWVTCACWPAGKASTQGTTAFENTALYSQLTFNHVRFTHTIRPMRNTADPYDTTTELSPITRLTRLVLGIIRKMTSSKLPGSGRCRTYYSTTMADRLWMTMNTTMQCESFSKNG